MKNKNIKADARLKKFFKMNSFLFFGFYSFVLISLISLLSLAANAEVYSRDPTPPDGFFDSPYDPFRVMTWGSTPDPAGGNPSYVVYFGTSSSNLKQLSQTNVVSSDLISSAYDLGIENIKYSFYGKTGFRIFNLKPSTNYYWRVDSRDSTGILTTGTVWKFSTKLPPPPSSVISDAASNPSPANNSLGAVSPVTLKWTLKQGESIQGIEFGSSKYFGNLDVIFRKMDSRNDGTWYYINSGRYPFQYRWIDDNTIEIKNLESFDQYFWRVKSYNGISPLWVFTVNSQSTPSVPDLPVPDPVPVNNAPTAKITASKTEAFSDETLVFDGTGSSDPDSGDFIKSYEWYIDNSFSSGLSKITRQLSPGGHTVKLKVTDTKGLSAETTIQILIKEVNEEANNQIYSDQAYTSQAQSTLTYAEIKWNPQNNFDYGMITDVGDVLSAVYGGNPSYDLKIYKNNTLVYSTTLHGSYPWTNSVKPNITYSKHDTIKFIIQSSSSFYVTGSNFDYFDSSTGNDPYISVHYTERNLPLSVDQPPLSSPVINPINSTPSDLLVKMELLEPANNDYEIKKDKSLVWTSTLVNILPETIRSINYQVYLSENMNDLEEKNLGKLVPYSYFPKSSSSIGTHRVALSNFITVPDTKYYWRVKANSGFNYKLSAIGNFTTIPDKKIYITKISDDTDLLLVPFTRDIKKGWSYNIRSSDDEKVNINYRSPIGEVEITVKNNDDKAHWAVLSYSGNNKIHDVSFNAISYNNFTFYKDSIVFYVQAGSYKRIIMKAIPSQNSELYTFMEIPIELNALDSSGNEYEYLTKVHYFITTPEQYSEWISDTAKPAADLLLDTFVGLDDITYVLKNPKLEIGTAWHLGMIFAKYVPLTKEAALTLGITKPSGAMTKTYTSKDFSSLVSSSGNDALKATTSAILKSASIEIRRLIQIYETSKLKNILSDLDKLNKDMNSETKGIIEQALFFLPDPFRQASTDITYDVAKTALKNAIKEELRERQVMQSDRASVHEFISKVDKNSILENKLKQDYSIVLDENLNSEEQASAISLAGKYRISSSLLLNETKNLQKNILMISKIINHQKSVSVQGSVQDSEASTVGSSISSGSFASSVLADHNEKIKQVTGFNLEVLKESLSKNRVSKESSFQGFYSIQIIDENKTKQQIKQQADQTVDQTVEKAIAITSNNGTAMSILGNTGNATVYAMNFMKNYKAYNCTEINQDIIVIPINAKCDDLYSPIATVKIASQPKANFEIRQINTGDQITDNLVLVNRRTSDSADSANNVLQLNLRPGKYSLKMEEFGYEITTDEFEITPEDEILMKVFDKKYILEPSKGILKIESNKENVSLIINKDGTLGNEIAKGKADYLGKASFSLLPGTYQLEASLRNYQSKKIQFEIQSARESSLKIEFTNDEINCKPEWKTEDWGVCADKIQFRNITKTNDCPLEINKPLQARVCCAESWICENWTLCSRSKLNETSTRACSVVAGCELSTTPEPQILNMCPAPTEAEAHIVISPEGAVVFIDDTLISNKSSTELFTVLSGGEHTIKVSLEGHQEITDKISVVPGLKVQRAYRLMPYATTILESILSRKNADNYSIVIGSEAALSDNIAGSDVAGYLGITEAVTDTRANEKNNILVGGPCANKKVAEFAAKGDFPYSCANWPKKNFVLLKTISSADKTTLVIAGTSATDTRRGGRIIAKMMELKQSLASSNAVFCSDSTKTEDINSISKCSFELNLTDNNEFAVLQNQSKQSASLPAVVNILSIPWKEYNDGGKIVWAKTDNELEITESPSVAQNSPKDWLYDLDYGRVNQFQWLMDVPEKAVVEAQISWHNPDETYGGLLLGGIGLIDEQGYFHEFAGIDDGMGNIGDYGFTGAIVRDYKINSEQWTLDNSNKNSTGSANLKLERNGNTVKIFINDKLISEHDVQGNIAGIALGTSGYLHYPFGTFKVKKLELKESP